MGANPAFSLPFRLVWCRRFLALSSQNWLSRRIPEILLRKRMDLQITETRSSSKRRMSDCSPISSDAKRSKTTTEEHSPDPNIDVTTTKGAKNVDKGKKRANTSPKDARRDRRGTRGTRNAKREDSAIETGGDVVGEKTLRLPKRACALLIGFCGTGFNGMQIQPNVRTIEGVFFDAMVKAGAVSQDNADDPVKVGLARAARTDAGVHAAGNLISIKMITAVPGVPDMVARINQKLPPEIRLWSILRTQNSFNARLSCDSRMYTYFLPSYILIPPKPDSNLARRLQSGTEGSGATFARHSFMIDWDLGNPPSDDLIAKRRFRIDGQQLAQLRCAAAQYLGTHNFHNFTVGRDFSDRSNHRFMKKIEVQDPVVYGNTEWIAIMFHGQSFMLHQRKMVCALVLACRTETPPSIIQEMFGYRKIVVPKAPALGLLLEQPLFEAYNKKVAKSNAKIPSDNSSDPNFRPLIDFEPHRALMDQFKQEQIYSRMRAQEDNEATFDAWIRYIDAYDGDDLLYLNSKGVIPSVAVLEKGQRRQRPFRERKRFDAIGPVSVENGRDSEDEDEEHVDKAKLKDMEG